MNMKNYEFTSAIEKIASGIKGLAESNTNKLDHERLELLEALAELGSTATELDTQLSFLRKQAHAIRITGFADWEDIGDRYDAEVARENTNASVVVPAVQKKIETKKSKTQKVSFPAFEYPASDIPESPVKVASILDTFSENAFSYEWINVPLTKEKWRSQLIDCDLLFVESAWAGNNNEWRYCLTGTSAPRPEVVELVEFAKHLRIPTVFWNKEDPPHFADFLRTAALFDVVLTTDESCVEKYKLELGHDKVGVLPFAAQPKIHNPIRPESVLRNRSVSFGGMYFAHKYPERREQMEYLLPAAAKFDFDIFSRQLGGDPNYQFPSPFDANVVGSLAYDQMLSAYHAYKVFLNVNSVTTSTTMCARRIFEILASGGSVVSAPSPAISHFFPDGLVPMPTNEQETYQEIRALLQPGGYRDKQVHQAQRIIWRNHTFAHRVDEIFNWAGIKHSRKDPTVSIISSTIRPGFVSHILAAAARQKNVNLELNLLLHGFEIDERIIREEAKILGLENVNILYASKESTLGENLNRLVSASSGDIVSKMDDDDFYGEHYLEDLVNAKMYSNAEVVGKASSYIHFESKGATILSYAASENRFSKFVRGATLTADRALFQELPFRELNRSEDTTFLNNVMSSGGKIYAADRFNFWIRRSSNQAHHTWSVADRELFATGPVVSFGDPTQFVGA